MMDHADTSTYTLAELQTLTRPCVYLFMKKGFRNIKGEVFGRLRVIKTAGQGKGKDRHFLWLCRCSCGAQRIVRSSHLISGRTRSCGCLRIKHGYSRGNRDRRAFYSSVMADARYHGSKVNFQNWEERFQQWLKARNQEKMYRQALQRVEYILETL